MSKNKNIIASALFMAVSAMLVSCETTDIDGAGAIPKPNGIRTVPVSFEGDFTAEERKAVIAGANMSRGTKLYGVKFVEYKGSGYLMRNHVRVNWFDVKYERWIPGHHGAYVNGFYAGKGYNLISINNKFRGSPRAIRDIVHHEADHAFGRQHLPPDQKRKLELLRGGNPIPKSQDWTKWPVKSDI